jgi:hypothetical protein
MAPKDYMTVEACVCSYIAIDPTDVKVCCVSEGEELCCFGKYCCAAGEAVLGPGPIAADKDKGEICHCGCGCCSCGLKAPAVCCKGRQSCLCLKGAAALPFDEEYVPAPVCVFCPGLQVMPNPGCCAPPFTQKWLDEHKDLDGVGGPAACEMTGR